MLDLHFGNLGVLFGILIIAGGLIAYFGQPILGGLIVLVSSALGILFPYYPRSYYVYFPIMGMMGGILTMINKWVKKLKEAELSLAALCVSAVFSYMFLAHIFRVAAWREAPSIISGFTYGALCLAFVVSLIIGMRVKTLWWILISFLISGTIGFVLNFIGAYLYELWNPPPRYVGDWDSSFESLALIIFTFLTSLATALFGTTGGALGVFIGKTIKAKAVKNRKNEESKCLKD